MSTTAELPTYDSLAQCAARTGIPLLVLRSAKRNGCAAFRWNRVALRPLLEWIFSERAGDLPDLPQLHAEQIRLQNQKLAAQVSILNGDWISAKEVEVEGARLGHTAKEIVCRLHLTAPDLAGLTAPEISERLRERERDILREFHTIHERVDRLRRDAANAEAQGNG